MAAKRLSVVPPGTKAQPPIAKTVTKAAEDGDRRELLIAMRARVAKAVEDPNTAARDLAALTRRLLEIAKDIEALDSAAAQEAAEHVDTADDGFDASAL